MGRDTEAAECNREGGRVQPRFHCLDSEGAGTDYSPGKGVKELDLTPRPHELSAPAPVPQRRYSFGRTSNLVEKQAEVGEAHPTS